MADLKYHLRLFLGIFLLVSLGAPVKADINTINIRILPDIQHFRIYIYFLK